MSTAATIIAGVGAALPAGKISNDELARSVQTSDEWIRTRTGISQRYVCSEGETTTTLASNAARHALAEAGLDRADITIVATATPDLTFPGVSSQIQQMLGYQGVAFDINAACSGFVHAMSIADSMMAQGDLTTALVVGADTFSNLLDWSDRRTAVLFGDGAGAVVLKRQFGVPGVLGFQLQGDGAFVEDLRATDGVATTQTSGFTTMNGGEVFKHAVRGMADNLTETLAAHGLDVDAVDHWVPHQANARLLQSAAKQAGISLEKVVMTVDRHANTSAASVPLALSVAVQEKRFTAGDLVAFSAFGAGFNWGTVLYRWQ